MENTIINLDDMNEKQRAKEFKATAKDVKSKDPAVKSRALSKLKDSRYFTMGSCLPSLLESMAPKKNMIDQSQAAIDALQLFIGETSFSGSSRAADCQCALRGLFDACGDLKIFSILTDLTTYKEEVKLVKSKVKGQPRIQPPENERTIELRSSALQAICGITTLLSPPNEVNAQLQSAFANIPGITNGMCNVLMALAEKYRDISKREGVLQELIWTLSVTVFVLRHNPNALATLLSFEGDILNLVAEMAAEKSLSYFCLHLLEIACRCESGMARITNATAVGLLVEVAEHSSDSLFQLAMAPSPRGGKDKPGREKLKKRQTAIHSDAADFADKKLIAEPKRLFLSYLKLLADIFTAVVRAKAEVLTPASVTKLVGAFSKAMLNSALWEIARNQSEAPFDLPLQDIFTRCCVLFGAIGASDSPQRIAADQAGAPRTLMSLLQESKAVIGGDQPTEGAEYRVMTLRRVAEQAILLLLTKKRVKEIESTPTDSTTETMSKRWPSAAFCYQTKDIGGAEQQEEAPPAYSPSQLLDIIGSADDHDLGSRGLRILAALAQGSEDPVAFVSGLNLDAASVGIICTAVQVRGTHMLAALDKEKANEQLQIGANINTEHKTHESLNGLSHEIENNNIQSAPLKETPPQDHLILTERSALYHALTVLELVLHASTKNINIFVVKERLVTLSSLLYRCGPSGNSDQFAITAAGNDGHIDPLSAVVKSPEVEASLYDPRNFSSLPEAVDDESLCDVVLLRPLIFDILSTIAAADAKYRTYEGNVPPEPTKHLPPSTSPCGDAAIAVTRVCGDACIATLMHGVTFKVVRGNVVALPAESPNRLDTSVLNAAVGMVIAMASCGAAGLYGVLESVAEVGFADSARRRVQAGEGAMHGLKAFLHNLCAEIQKDPTAAFKEEQASGILAVHQSDLDMFSEAVRGPFAWTRTQFFDQLLADTSYVPSALKLLLTSPMTWPYLCFCAALVAVIASPQSNTQTAALAIDAIRLMCQTPVLHNVSQPVVIDTLAAVLLSIGGGVAIVGALGRFGTLSDTGKVHGLEFVEYLIRRGALREDFWSERRNSTTLLAASDPKGKKREQEKKKDAIDKKPPQPGKKDPKKEALLAAAVQSGMAVAEVIYNTEPDGTHPDPNHGPSRALWKTLLSVACDDIHAFIPAATPLVSALQGGIDDVTGSLIDQHAAIDTADGNGLAPLMYALVLGNVATTNMLIAAEVDLDIIDADGNPALKYACLSLFPEDLIRALPGPLKASDASVKSTFKGHMDLLGSLLEAQVDVAVCDKAGNSSLLWCMGLGALTVSIGGYTLTISNGSYAEEAIPRETTLIVVDALLKSGAIVNACNRQGVVPLHVAAARGDLALVDLLQQFGAFANAADTGGYLPLHYVVAACPENALNVFDFILALANERPIEVMTFSDVRTGLSKEEKYDLDVAMVMKKTFEEVLSPRSIPALRKSAEELIQAKANDGMNLFQLCMTAHVLGLERFSTFLCGGKTERMALAIHLLCVHNAEANGLLDNIDVYGMTALHAATLLFQGITPRVELTEQEKRNKRVKKYPSPELHILDRILASKSLDVDAICSRPVASKKIPRKLTWTALHGAIVGDNYDLVHELLVNCKANITHSPYVHFCAERPVSGSVCEMLIDAAASSSSFSVLLNAPDSGGLATEPARPLHLAVRHKNLGCITMLLKCSKVDPNVRDEVSGHTALQEACIAEDLELIRSFSPASDRLDLLVEDNQGWSCVETAINSTIAVAILTTLIEMRRNDVIERITSFRSHLNSTILFALERDNMSLVESLRRHRAPPAIEAFNPTSKDNVTAVTKDFNGEAGSLTNAGEDEISILLAATSLADECDSPPMTLPSMATDAAEEIKEGFEFGGPTETMPSYFPNKAVASAETAELAEDVAIVQGQSTDVDVVSIERLADELQRSDQVLKTLLEALGKSGGPAIEVTHAHPCYTQGILYSDHCASEST